MDDLSLILTIVFGAFGVVTWILGWRQNVKATKTLKKIERHTEVIMANTTQETISATLQDSGMSTHDANALTATIITNVTKAYQGSGTVLVTGGSQISAGID